jgi:glycosyltransferase involved in cell wall biosynthesis
MRIVFICGTLQAGSDGVADYTLRLARELSLHTIDCFFLSLHDRFVPADVLIDDTKPQSSLPRWLRISSTVPWPEKTTPARDFLRLVSPDWISLQFVPFAFHPKGLPNRLKRCLLSLEADARWHIMAHELWVDPQASLASKLLSVFQKRLICSLVSSLKPSILDSTNLFYQSSLQSCGFRCGLLPLFSNIDFHSINSMPVSSPHCLTFVFFGTIHPEWDPSLLISSLLSVLYHLKIKTIEFLSVGLAGEHGQTLWRDLTSSTPSSVTFRQLGPLPSLEISRHLQQADFGVTTTPSHLLGKSGSVAAMLAHGLPVVVPRLDHPYGPWHESFGHDDRFILVDSYFPGNLARARKLPPHDQLADTANRFIQSLESA